MTALQFIAAHQVLLAFVARALSGYDTGGRRALGASASARCPADPIPRG